MLNESEFRFSSRFESCRYQESGKRRDRFMAIKRRIYK